MTETGKSDIGYIFPGGKMGVTNEGGLALRLTNKTGGASIKGYLAQAAEANDDAFILSADDIPDNIGVIYEAGIADGAECWIVVNGIVEVYFEAAVTHGDFVRSQVNADGGTVGVAVAEAEPTSPFATDKHFQEIGHLIQSTGGAGLARCIVHLN